MKIIFLDHDGVICLSTEWGTRFKSGETFDPFNAKAVKVLNEILKETDAEIVVSSDWRFHATVEDLGEWYKKNSILKVPIDTTTVKLLKKPVKLSQNVDMEQNRALQIREWLDEHPEVTHWVAIDDMNMSNIVHHPWDESRKEWGLVNFVQTPIDDEGIKQTGIKEKIIAFLNQDTTMYTVYEKEVGE